MSHQLSIMQSVWELLLVCAITCVSEPIIVELEASMHSTLLTDLQESVSRVTTFSDSVAVVGQMFRMRIPLVSENCHVTNILFKMDTADCCAWLHWDHQLCLLQGLPLEGDKGHYRFSFSPAAIQNHDAHIHRHLVLSGSKLSSSSHTDTHQTDFFTITVNQEDQQEPELVPLALQSYTNGTTVCVCSGGQPVTVLTVILDADLTKMYSRERLVLLQKMSQFGNVAPELMRVMPVINNHFFDMTAFMAGPGNAKKVVENGALLFWKLGCALDQSNLPDISGVELPAKDGTMSFQLGYPVVGWYIVNKKPHMVRRIRRQLHNSPTPVPSQFTPTVYSEPAERIVPAQASPFVAASTNLLVNPARGPLPLPIKPTIRIRDRVAYTPVLGHPLPTRFLGSTSTLPLQPTLTRMGYVEPTASVTPPTTRRPKISTPKKSKKQKTPSLSIEPKTTNDKAPKGSLPNQKPELHNPIDEINAWVGTYFEVKIPADTFFDQEDGSTEKLRLSLHQTHKQVLDEGSWIQFNSTSQLLYGLPDHGHVGRHEFFMMAIDKEHLSTTDAFEVNVNPWPTDDQSPVVFTARFQGEPSMLSKDIHKKILFSKKLASALGDRNSSTITLKNITWGSIIVEWTNSSLPRSPCPREQIQAMCHRISDANGHPTPIFYSVMQPEFKPMNVTVRGVNKCQRFLFVPPQEVSISLSPVNVSTQVPSTIVAPSSSSGWSRSDDVYLHTVIPAVVVAALLLCGGFIAMVCYRKKHNGKMTTEEQATFIKKGVPIIFADELDDAKSPSSSSMPLILREEKPPLPPPQYSSSACGEGSLLNHQILGEYICLSSDDPGTLPYQPPPPFTIPIESRGSRPKNMTSYRCPPPYVPP